MYNLFSMNEFNPQYLNRELTGYPDTMIFVVFQGQVGIGGVDLSHETVAYNTGLFDQTIKNTEEKLSVDDGGILYDYGNYLLIDSYFSRGTKIQPLVGVSKSDLTEAKKALRRKTGQLVADCSGRKVKVVHEDKSEESFEPQSLQESLRGVSS